MVNSLTLKIKSIPASFYVLCLLCFGYSSIYGQAGFVSSSNDLSGANGKVTYSMGQSFTLNSTGVNGSTVNGIQQPFSIYTLGVGDAAFKIDVSVFPNPVSKMLVLKSQLYGHQGMNYKLYDLLGTLMVNKPINESETRIDLSDFQAATYILNVSSDSKTVKSFRIIKH